MFRTRALSKTIWETTALKKNGGIIIAIDDQPKDEEERKDAVEKPPMMNSAPAELEQPMEQMVMLDGEHEDEEDGEHEDEDEEDEEAEEDEDEEDKEDKEDEPMEQIVMQDGVELHRCMLCPKSEKLYTIEKLYDEHIPLHDPKYQVRRSGRNGMRKRCSTVNPINHIVRCPICDLETPPPKLTMTRHSIWKHMRKFHNATVEDLHIFKLQCSGCNKNDFVSIWAIGQHKCPIPYIHK